MQEYVAGFLFSPDENYVVLVRKLKPTWQAGLLNGVGGKVELEETPYQAMVREFKEETGLYIHDWEYFAGLSDGRNFAVTFYRMQHPWYGSVQTVTNEVIEIHAVQDLDKLPVVSNLRWLIPMARSTSRLDWPYLIRERHTPL